mmetsp:Transcript_15258/g.21441  ORF Transcript_15258/g.21441 Transcript_15258/m.21441 type:complete len:385 (+) Transcript_15258:198-1352(+)|eukprot:CAMPEP_0184478460 /NCGR_PEP_ID=MMETSP0113_2-20130426/484_1 /TAXON_ID=91329 /ORGANISM="Norrisiella sphaerica, Strain BC52" /LENGTH=384 /DNA_ID=CAMNT_0026856265 /DNA_START=176 /DNA_END=1330 /DNA_ORIENTATION=+
MAEHMKSEDPVQRTSPEVKVQRRMSKLKIDTRMALTRKTTLGTTQKDPEEGAVSYRAYVPPSSFSPKTKTGPSPAFAGKVGSRFKDAHSHYRKNSNPNALENLNAGHKTWKAKGNVGMDSNKSPRFKGGIYKKPLTDNVGLGHEELKAKGGPKMAVTSPRKVRTWLKNKGNPDNEGAASLESAKVPSSFASGKKGTAFAGPVGKRFNDPNSYLKNADKIDDRSLAGHQEWKAKRGAGQYASDQSKRFEKGGIYKEALTDNIGLGHAKTKVKGAALSSTERKSTDWLKTKGLQGNEGSETFLSSPVRSDFNAPKTKSPTSAFSGTTGNRFKDVHSHLRRASRDDTREMLNGHKDWKPKKGVKMDASNKDRFTSGSIYQKSFSPIK